MLKDKIAFEVGYHYINDSNNEVGSSKIKDPVGRRAKGERNIRKRNIVEIKCNQTRGKRKSAFTHASRIKTTTAEIHLYVVLPKKMGSIPEHNFLNMLVMSMLSAFNSSQVSKRLTTLLPNTVIVVATFSIRT
ncbi:hypothetical protein M9H77_03693 [Catharanthus roseus]|uniref:Uncharacterized protein n=1 Tax=Catharanthus roseus TaxID=4058 RepID=A0ACC0CC51_CATRO|nr:hypothetical protein M9H77_03693 [Catharanthus roseus]